MRRLLFLAFFPFLLSAQAPDGEPDMTTVPSSAIVYSDEDGWLQDYDEALSNAKKEKRTVLVYFTGSDWCPPCKMLKKDLFDTTDFKAIAADYTLLYVDMPRDRNLLSAEQLAHNSRLLRQINKKGVFPLLVILNDEGGVLDQYSGYNMDGKIQGHIDFLTKNKG